jgi:hypothetical protein
MVRAGGWRAVAAAATCVALVSAACGGDDDDSSSDGGDDQTEDVSSTESTEDDESDATTETTEPPTPEEAAVAAYQESWDVTFLATNPPEELPEIRELLTGEALSETLTLINTLAREGQRLEGSMQTHPVVISATSTEVLLDDCAVENSVETDAAGTVVDTAEDALFNYRVRVVNEEGAWKVADFERREEPCEPQ